MRGLRTPRSPLLPPRAEVGGARVAMPGIHCVALPPRFHSALLDLAEERWGWGVAAHGPYGAPLPPPLPSGWHNTSDYALEPLFHARAQRSHEPDAAAATAVYAPYYAGLALRLLGPARAAALEAELLEELALSSAWVRGRPHADPNPNPNPDPNPHVEVCRAQHAFRALRMGSRMAKRRRMHLLGTLQRGERRVRRSSGGGGEPSGILSRG